MAQVGAPYSVVDGRIFTPWGDNGMVYRVTGGTAVRSPVAIRNVSGPSDGGDPVFSFGNYQHSVRLSGHATEGKASYTGVTYTHATKTLSKAGAFSDVAVGESVYVSGGTGATAGWYEIATNADDNTVTLTTAPGSGDQSDFALYGLNTLSGVNSGLVTIQLGNGETWSGTAWVANMSPTFNMNSSRKVPVPMALQFTGPVTVTTGLV